MQLRYQPAALVLSRQPLPTLDRTRYATAADVAHGAYVLADNPGGNPKVILMASGSEVSVAVDAHEKLLAGAAAYDLRRAMEGSAGGELRSAS